MERIKRTIIVKTCTQLYFKKEKVSLEWKE